MDKNSIAVKSVGELIDQLITADIICYVSQDVIMDKSKSEEIRFKAAIRAQESNGRRNQLIRAINEVLEMDDNSPHSKTYIEGKD
jgi:hypothetical protein